MTRPPRLVRLTDDPATLPDALIEVWERGDAAIVADPRAELAPAIDAALAGDAHLPAGTALVVPTSGSTGTPRGVVLSHAALAASTAASLTALDCEPGERWALALPLRHIAGLQVLARARALGAPPHVIADPGDPRAIAAAAADAEHVALVPTQLVRCLDSGVDLTRFRSVLVGGGPLDAQQRAAARASGVRLVQSYGMTETCGGCVYDGAALSGVEVRVEPNGRIALRGPMLATGYLHPSAEDAARFTDDGWFVTDDLGDLRTDADGSHALEVIGRVDDVIISGGIKIVPSIIERSLRAVDGVVDVAVLGVPDAEWGERVRAVVVPQDVERPPTLEDLRRAVANAHPNAHGPRDLVITDRIVRDGLGKMTSTERTRLRFLEPVARH